MAGYTHAGRQSYFQGSIDRRRAYPVAARAPTRLDWLDCALICLFLLGLYTNYTIQISAKVPFHPCRRASPVCFFSGGGGT
jgi:hypothetical protein